MELHGVLYHVPHKVRGQRIEELLKLFELWERRKRPGEDLLRRHEAAARDCARLSAHAARSSFSTSRRWASIRRAATSSGRTSRRSTKPRRSPSSSPRTTWTRPTAWRTASPSSTTARSWPRELPRELKEQTEHRLAGRRIPRAHRLVDSRRERELDRPACGRFAKMWQQGGRR